MKAIKNKLAKVILAIEQGTIDEKTGRALIYGCATLADIIKGADIEAKVKRIEMREKRQDKPAAEPATVQ